MARGNKGGFHGIGLAQWKNVVAGNWAINASTCAIHEHAIHEQRAGPVWGYY